VLIDESREAIAVMRRRFAGRDVRFHPVRRQPERSKISDGDGLGRTRPSTRRGGSAR
jgi:hypothetical protein